MGSKIEGVIKNSSNFVIEYHLQRNHQYKRSAMTEIKIQPKFTINSAGISCQLFSFHKKVQYFNSSIHSFVRLPSGRVCWSGLTQLPQRQCLLSIYVLCTNENENGQVFYMCIKKDVLISACYDVCLEIRADFSVRNIDVFEAKTLRKSSSNYSNSGNNLDQKYFLRIGTTKPATNLQQNLPEIHNPAYKKKVYINPTEQRPQSHLQNQENIKAKKKKQKKHNDDLEQESGNSKKEENKNQIIMTESILQKYVEKRIQQDRKKNHSAPPIRNNRY